MNNDNNMRGYPLSSIEDEIGIKVALAEPIGKSSFARKTIMVYSCPVCNGQVEKRVRVSNGQVVDDRYFCNGCKHEVEPVIEKVIKNVPLSINEQYTKDSTTGYYDEFDSINVALLDDMMLYLRYIQENHGFNLQPSHDYYLGEKTKYSTISKSRNGQLSKALLTKRVETTEKVEQKISSFQNKKKGFFGGSKNEI